MSKVKNACPIRNLSAKLGMGRVVAEALVAKCTDAEKAALANGDMDTVLDIVQKKNAPLPEGKPVASSSGTVSEAVVGHAKTASQ